MYTPKRDNAHPGPFHMGVPYFLSRLFKLSLKQLLQYRTQYCFYKWLRATQTHFSQISLIVNSRYNVLRRKVPCKDKLVMFQFSFKHKLKILHYGKTMEFYNHAIHIELYDLSKLLKQYYKTGPIRFTIINYYYYQSIALYIVFA